MRQAAADIGRLTTPSRDLEVMVEELERQGLTDEARVRRVRLAATRHQSVVDQRLKVSFEHLNVEEMIARSLTKHIDKIHLAFNDEHFDLHELDPGQTHPIPNRGISGTVTFVSQSR
jgi:hypothetical protein